MIRHVLIYTIIICLLFSNTGYAVDVENIATPETISAQSVRGDDIISPYHVTGESLVRLLQQMANFDTPGSNIIFNRRSAQLFVRNTPTNHETIQRVLNDLRRAQYRQILIEARIITVSSTDIDDLGLDFFGIDARGTRAGRTYSTDSSFGDGNYATNIDFPNVTDSSGNDLGGQVSFASLSSKFNIEAYIDALRSRAEVNTLSSPQLIVANNQRANIKIEKAQYYVQSVEADASDTELAVDPEIGIAQSGTILDVTPTINSDGTISLDMHPQFVTVDLSNTQTINVRGGIADSLQPTVTLPVFNVQTADTTVTVDNGGVAIIGGMIEETENKGFYKVPFLGDIPILGRAFSSNQVQEIKTHLIIFVKATVKDARKSFIQ